MHRLVDDDLEARAERALQRADADVRATVRAWLARPRDPTVEDIVEILELAPDEIASSIARFCDARVLAGEPPERTRAELERLRVFFDGVAEVDLEEIVARVVPKARVGVDPNASREELLRHLTGDPYASTVVRRLFGIPGVIPTQAFLRALVELDLRPADEPHVDRLVRSLGSVVNAHVEIIEALRRARA
jgi:hypothetical protein